jgi:hypothetical protein
MSRSRASQHCLSFLALSLLHGRFHGCWPPPQSFRSFGFRDFCTLICGGKIVPENARLGAFAGQLTLIIPFVGNHRIGQTPPSVIGSGYQLLANRFEKALVQQIYESGFVVDQ